MSTVRHALMTVALALPAALAVAQAETLEDAWRMAVERDAGLAATRSLTEAGRADELAARAGRWPTRAARRPTWIS